NFSALNPNSWTDTFGDAHPIYSTLGDLGTSTDFVNITGSVDPVGVPFGDANDPRPTLGKVPGGSKLGAVWYHWNDTSPETVLIDATSGGFVNSTTGQPQSDPAAILVDKLVTFGAVPEPGSLAL